MKRSISAEWLKLRHSRIGLVIAVLPIISMLIEVRILFEPRRSAKWLVQLVDSGQPVLRCFFLTYFDSYLLLLYL